jgi:hypothetical protein
MICTHPVREPLQLMLYLSVQISSYFSLLIRIRVASLIHKFIQFVETWISNGKKVQRDDGSGTNIHGIRERSESVTIMLVGIATPAKRQGSENK